MPESRLTADGGGIGCGLLLLLGKLRLLGDELSELPADVDDDALDALEAGGGLAMLDALAAEEALEQAGAETV